MINEPLDLNGSPEEVAAFEARFQATVPQEKAIIDRQGLEIGAQLREEGGQAVEGVGQKMGEVPPRLYLRWIQHDKDFWKDEINVHKFFADNPQFCSPGWKPWKHLHSPKHRKMNLKDA